VRWRSASASSASGGDAPELLPPVAAASDGAVVVVVGGGGAAEDAAEATAEPAEDAQASVGGASLGAPLDVGAEPGAAGVAARLLPKRRWRLCRGVPGDKNISGDSSLEDRGPDFLLDDASRLAGATRGAEELAPMPMPPVG